MSLSRAGTALRDAQREGVTDPRLQQAIDHVNALLDEMANQKAPDKPRWWG